MNTAIDSSFCRLEGTSLTPEPALIVIFGASGDLAHRKIFPALYDLFLEGRLPEDTLMLGVARRSLTTSSFRDELAKACMVRSRHAEKSASGRWDDFASQLYYLKMDSTRAADYEQLSRLIVDRDGSVLDEDFSGVLPPNVLYYLAVGPELFPIIAERLGEAQCGSRQPGSPHEERKGSVGWLRLVVEKPYGRDRESARQLTATLHRWFDERDIYRIDHYLGKEAVQNLLYLRFANAVFEPLWNRTYLDSIEITVAEREGIGTRGGYYDSIGAARDMLQNHLVQLLCLTAMEPPASLSPEDIRDEKVKVLKAIPEYTAEEMLSRARRGQYTAGILPDGRQVPAYREEPKVAPDSVTETFASLTLTIENWRFAGVPVTLRTAKASAEQYSEIVVHFKRPPAALFAARCGDQLAANSLTIRIQPDEGVWLSFNAKVPGQPAITSSMLRFSYRQVADYFPEAYERLLLDALSGDSTLFIRADESEEAWRIIDQLEAAWKQADPDASPAKGGLFLYPAGSSISVLAAEERTP